MPVLALFLMAGGALGALAPAALAAQDVPETPTHPVSDSYNGTVVREDYRWLEEGTHADVKAWSEAQNLAARSFLDALPDRPNILDRVSQLSQSIAPLYFALRSRNGVLFAIKDQPPKQQPMLVRLDSPNDTSRVKVLVDPNELDPSGSTTIDFYVPSLDGSRVAVSMSVGGTENGTVSVFDARTGARLSDDVPGVNGGTAGGSVAWNADGTGFWRTRYPQRGERPDEDLPFYQQIYFHRIGTPASSDVYVLGKEFPKIAEIQLATSDDGRWVLANVFNGDGGEHAFWLATRDGRFRQITRFEDKVEKATFGSDALYMLSRKNAPNGKLLRLPLGASVRKAPGFAQATVIVPEGKTAIDGFLPTATRLYVEDMVGGPSQVRILDGRTGKLLGRLPIPAVTSVGGMVRTTGDAMLIHTESYTEPDRWWSYSPRSPKLSPTALKLESPASFSDTQVRRVFATSKDGTRVPINILFRKGTRLDGSAPLLLTGYGGYGLSMTPSFSPLRRLWIEQGGIFAVANIRGGGEYGDDWHLAGNLTRKQNVFDDFAASAQYLVDHRYTKKNRLAIEGGSNGGLLMGAMLTQHPELFRAVISHVGLYDMLRVELSPNGLFNTTEFGTVKNPAQFRALYAYSPYHHVKNGTRYPATLMLTGENDPRVEPWQSRKMVARLQAATASSDPILLRTSGTTGHGMGTPLSERIVQTADVYSFLFRMLGMSYRPVASIAGPLP